MFGWLGALLPGLIAGIPGLISGGIRANREKKYREEETRRLAGDYTREYQENLRSSTEDVTQTYSTAARRLAAGGMRERNLEDRKQATLAENKQNIYAGYKGRMQGLGYGASKGGTFTPPKKSGGGFFDWLFG